MSASSQKHIAQLPVNERVILSKCDVKSQIEFDGVIPNEMTFYRTSNLGVYDKRRRARVERRIFGVVFVSALTLFTRGLIITARQQ
jgi:hypothetical protein